MSDEDAWLHRYSILVAFCVLLVLITGAVVTSLDCPISPVPSMPTTPAPVSFESWHPLCALFVAALVAGLVPRQVGWLLLSIFLAEGTLAARL
jgi:hypothetical protein